MKFHKKVITKICNQESAIVREDGLSKRVSMFYHLLRLKMVAILLGLVVNCRLTKVFFVTRLIQGGYCNLPMNLKNERLGYVYLVP